MKRREKLKHEGERRSIFMRYLGEVATALDWMASQVSMKSILTCLDDFWYSAKMDALSAFIKEAQKPAIRLRFVLILHNTAITTAHPVRL